MYTCDLSPGYTRGKTGRLRQEEEEVSRERQLLNASKLESLILKLCKTWSARLDWIYNCAKSGSCRSVREHGAQ